MIAVGIIGFGFSGPNIANCVARTKGCELVAVSDNAAEALRVAGELHPEARLVGDWRDLVTDTAVDAVIVSTPLETHFEIALSALRNGKHVLVDKPIAATSDEAALLIQESAHRRRVLMVDHKYVYDPAVEKIKEAIDSGDIGNIYSYDSTRVEVGYFDRDLNAIWGISIYDLSILDYVFPANPILISATAPRGDSIGSESIANISLFFDDGTLAHMNANWLAPIRIHQSTITGSRQFVVYDDLNHTEKLKIYDLDSDVVYGRTAIYERIATARTGDMRSPVLRPADVLQSELQHFADCISRGVEPLTSGLSGLRVVQSLEAATLSMRRNGQPIEIRQSKETA